MRINFTVFFLVLCIVLAGCSSTKQKGRYREADNKGQQAALSVNEERKLTQEALPQMHKDYPPTQNRELQAYISRLGQKIVQANGLHSKPYTYNFTVVETTQVNAFALPAGEVFMTTAIIAMADSEAEIAGVLGHEIGHVTARHTAERMYVAKKEQPKMWAFGGIGAALGGGLGYFAGSKLCDPKDTACKAKYTVYGAGAGGVGGLMVQKYAFMKNSQEDELESDRVGFRYAVKAGYDKDKVGDFYAKLMAMEKDAKKGQNAAMVWLSDAMSSHPSSNDRVSQSNELKAKFANTSGIASTPEFMRMKQLAQEINNKQKSKQTAKN